MSKKCKCKVCKGWRKAGLKLFRVCYQDDHNDDILDYYFFGTADKTMKEFRKLVKKVAKKTSKDTKKYIKTGGPWFNSEECVRELMFVLRDNGFIPVSDYEEGNLWVAEKSPKTPAWMKVE